MFSSFFIGTLLYSQSNHNIYADAFSTSNFRSQISPAKTFRTHNHKSRVPLAITHTSKRLKGTESNDFDLLGTSVSDIKLKQEFVMKINNHHTVKEVLETNMDR